MKTDFKHTPGKWQIANIGGIIQIESPDAVVCRMVNQGASVKPLEQEKSDAKLIAAAPELLEALLILLDEDAPELGFRSLSASERIKRAKAAIKKATE
jgi:hypothetical protein